MRVRIRDVVAPVFWPVHRAIARGTVQELVAKGGRGSGKSSYISIELVLQLLRHPACHAVVLRKIGGTLRTSVYAQIQWAIGALGLAKQFRCTVSPMECTYLPTGQKILFFGTDDPGKLVHHSTYRDLPPAWLGERFLADAAHLEQTNPTAFRHEYLGEAVGCGTAVFGNIQLQTLTTEQCQSFDRVYHGVDWGWYPDPWAYNAVHYDAARRTLVIFDELTRRRTPNRETARLLLDRGLDRTALLTADAAEPKSCADYRAAGLPCRAAVKGPGSVAAGMKWLQSLNAIIIDPVRCPETAAEFTGYEYLRDARTGEVTNAWPDADNHHIDAVRYALESVWRRRGS
ncbi:MAG: PBSX family phage terminase large subunit [Subdoligranulum sp.]